MEMPTFILRLSIPISCIYFFRLAHNDRGYGHGRFAGVFAVAQRQSECGRKTRKVHISQPVNIGVCYAVVVWFKELYLILSFRH